MWDHVAIVRNSKQTQARPTCRGRLNARCCCCAEWVWYVFGGWWTRRKTNTHRDATVVCLSLKRRSLVAREEGKRVPPIYYMLHVQYIVLYKYIFEAMGKIIGPPAGGSNQNPAVPFTFCFAFGLTPVGWWSVRSVLSPHAAATCAGTKYYAVCVMLRHHLDNDRYQQQTRSFVCVTGCFAHNHFVVIPANIHTHTKTSISYNMICGGKVGCFCSQTFS